MRYEKNYLFTAWAVYVGIFLRCHLLQTECGNMSLLVTVIIFRSMEGTAT